MSCSYISLPHFFRVNINILQYKPTELTLRDADGTASKLTVNLKYLPVKMQLDPSESINNMGTLRVNVLDATDLPSADRNGFSDPYCKFDLNGKKVYETKHQNKTLHPKWNEVFTVPIPSRTQADLKVRVLDWDFGDKPDFLGAAAVNLELLEPFKPQEINLALDGKSGAIRLRLVFSPDYVTRSRQGSSTFNGTFATPVKVIGAPVKGVGKVGGAVGGGVMKGASFFRHGFRGKNDSQGTANGYIEPTEISELTNGNGTMIASTEAFEQPTLATDEVPSTLTPHNRTASFGSKSITSAAGGTPGKPEVGAAAFNILSATGFPASAKVQVHIKQITSKGGKDVHKTKAIKSASGQVQWDQESFHVSCSPDCQFQVQVKDDKMFGGDDLGDALFFVDDSAAGSEKTVKVGNGSVVLKTSFSHGDPAAGRERFSPKSGVRRSLLSKREFSRGGMQG